MTTTVKTPGVYINEINTFPDSVMPSATAIPAFIGYTPAAQLSGQSLLNKAVLVQSYEEFVSRFMHADALQPVQYYPQGGDDNYELLPDPATVYYLCNSMRLFFENGGGSAYVVSVGNYGKPSGNPLSNAQAAIINPNVLLADLLRGLHYLAEESEPTLYLCPDATVLSVAENATLMQAMLLQAEQLEYPFCLFDIIGGRNPDPLLYSEDIRNFRESTGSNGLKNAACYYPFIGTTMVGSNELNYTNLFGGNLHQLAAFLHAESDGTSAVSRILADIAALAEPSAAQIRQHDMALRNASKRYNSLQQRLNTEVNILPVSAAMAGIYVINDSNEGVWRAPANVSIVGAAALPIRLSDHQQAELNIDEASGKSINAIRFFNGQGILVWGARTLDGNSQDWRYIPVRRTALFLERSIQEGMKRYIFAANDANTWNAVKAMIENFLTNIWKEGGLQGASTSDAFSVTVGLGGSMTSDDILNGRLRVSVKVAIVRPAEFIVLNFEQQQADS